jgi:site-specific recombinase XerD
VCVTEFSSGYHNMNRPKEWDIWNNDKRIAWLQSSRTKSNGGRRPKLTDKDKERVWSLLRRFENKSLVAEILGVHRRTLYRFLERFPIPETFRTEKKIEDYPEIQVYTKRQLMHSKQRTLDNYLHWIEKFHTYQKEHHPNRMRPRLWNSDDILEWVQKQPDYLQHNAIVSLRQLSKKAQEEFPLINLGLLPTRRTHKKKRSLADREEYYLTSNQVKRMIENVPKGDKIIEARNQAIISLLFNIACRTGDPSKGKGLCGIRIENLHLDDHRLIMKDKHDITWNVLGLSDATIQYLRKYFELRGNPKVGFLLTNSKGRPMSASDVNGMIKEAGKNAGIEGKRLVAKAFRKSFVKYALDDCGMNPVSLIGTGKETQTCFCVGWTDMKVLMKYYAPKLTKQIEQDRQKFAM